MDLMPMSCFLKQIPLRHSKKSQAIFLIENLVNKIKSKMGFCNYIINIK